MSRSVLDPYVSTDNTILTCYEDTELFAHQLRTKKKITDLMAYDLMQIFENFKESYRLEYIPDIRADMTNLPDIGSHRGSDYFSKNHQAGHRYPAIGHDNNRSKKYNDHPFVGSFDIDTNHKRILYNPRSSVSWRDSYILRKNVLITTHTVSDIVQYLTNSGYTMIQVSNLSNAVHLQKLPIRSDFHTFANISNSFTQQTGIHDHYAFVVDGIISLENIKAWKLLPLKELPADKNTEEIIQLLQQDRNPKK